MFYRDSALLFHVNSLRLSGQLIIAASNIDFLSSFILSMALFYLRGRIYSHPFFCVLGGRTHGLTARLKMYRRHIRVL